MQVFRDIATVTLQLIDGCFGRGCNGITRPVKSEIQVFTVHLVSQGSVNNEERGTISSAPAAFLKPPSVKAET